MGKKVKEYKSGDFIFAKVKGYPAWPARVQKPNGKKYFVYFYGTGETANLPPNMIFDYAENKDKFLTKTVKRRDFNDGVKQIEYDFANNVPLEEVIGVPVEVHAEVSTNDTANDSALDTTMDESVADTTANDTVAEDANVTQTDAVVEDSDDAGPLVIDERKTPSKGRKAKPEAKAKETPKPAKTPRGKGKKDEPKEKEKDKEDDKIDEEVVSRSGRKIRPKRYIDEQTEDNATLPSPSPAPKRRRASPVVEKEKPDAPKEKEAKNEKTFTEYNVVKQSELEGLKKPFEPTEDDKEKENILIAYLPNGAYAGIRVFQARPKAFKNEAARLQWDKQAARNALTLKMQLEREHITAQSVATQLVMELNLTDEEKATLDKERETEEKKSRVNFLKTEMKLIELDAKIKTCLCLEKADTELCLTLLDELLGLEVKPLMLLKHPTCLETVKRMRAYVGNTPSWDLSEQDALRFSKQAHAIRRRADALYRGMKEHFQTPEGLSFWEYFSERVLAFKKVTGALNAGELLELVHEPAELSNPSAVTMRAAIDEANSAELPPEEEEPGAEDDDKGKKKAAKPKKPTPASTPSKSRRTRPKKDDETPDQEEATEGEEIREGDGESEKEGGSEETSKEPAKEPESTPTEPSEDVEMAEPEKATENEVTNDNAEKETQDPPEESETSEKIDKSKQNKVEKPKELEKPEKSSKKDKKSKEDKSESEKNVKDNDSEKSGKDSEKKEKKNSKDDKNSNSKSEKNDKESEKSGKEKGDKSEDKAETEKSDEKEKDEPRAKRSRESKKTEPPPRSPAKRKSKF